MFGNQQGPRPSAADTEGREWEAVEKARRREEMTERVEPDDVADAAGGTRRRWWQFWRRSES